VADPVRFVPSYDFSDFEETQPNDPKPGVQLDSQFDDISASTTSLRDAILDVRRSDGALVNGIVTEDSLADGLVETLTAMTGSAAITEAATAIAAAETLAETAAAQLETVAELIGNASYYADWGDFHSEPGASADWGNWQ
jgi:hypothetical protein